MNTRRLASLLASVGLAQVVAAQCPPSRPQNVNATNGANCANIEVTWDEVSGATSYIVYRSTGTTFGNAITLATVLGGGNTDFTDITALVGTNYYYWVVARRSLCLTNNTSPPSDPDNGWRNVDPMAPTDVTASDGTVCSGVVVSWNQPTPSYGGVATAHTIYRNTINIFLGAASVGTAGSGGGYFVDTTAEVGTTYYYWVRAENPCGNALSGSDAGTVSNDPNPANDLCGLAASIQPGTYAGSTACATRDGDATCDVAGSVGPDVWYAFLPPSNGTLHADTCLSGGSFNTVLSVRSGGGCPGTEIACNNDSCGIQSSLNVAVTQGTIYKIRVGGRGSLDMGAFVLNVGFTPAATTCYANCDGSTVAPILNVQDFSCFLNKFAAGDTYANCDGSTVAPVLNVQDFSCFLNKFAAGCS